MTVIHLRTSADQLLTKKQLAAERSNWNRLTAAMAGILNPPEAA